METFRISALDRETCIGSVWIRDGLDYILTGRLRSKIVGVFGMVTGNSMDASIWKKERTVSGCQVNPSL